MKKKRSDIIIASRFLQKSKVNGLGYFRKILSIFARITFTIFFPFKNLSEYTCNFRALILKLFLTGFERNSTIKLEKISCNRTKKIELSSEQTKAINFFKKPKTKEAQSYINGKILL